MSTRLQVVMDGEELATYRRQATREGVTLSEWVRRALRSARRRGRRPVPERRIEALERALACGHPTADVDEMLREIERGRGLR